jgi:hypothetical protein
MVGHIDIVARQRHAVKSANTHSCSCEKENNACPDAGISVKSLSPGVDGKDKDGSHRKDEGGNDNAHETTNSNGTSHADGTGGDGIGNVFAKRLGKMMKKCKMD